MHNVDRTDQTKAHSLDSLECAPLHGKFVTLLMYFEAWQHECMNTTIKTKTVHTINRLNNTTMAERSDLKAELERKKQRLAQIREEKKRKEEERKKKEVSAFFCCIYYLSFYHLQIFVL